MSDLGATIFLLVCCYPILPIMAALMANEAKAKKNIVIGCTLPFTAQHDPRVEELCRAYRKWVWRWFFILTAAVLPAFFIGRMSLSLAWMMLWVIAALVPYCVLFARYNGRLRALKKQEGWATPYTGAVVADLGAKPEELGRPYSRWLFIPPLIISLVPCALALFSENEGERWGGMILAGTFALCCLMSIIFYPLVFRQRPDVVDSDSRVNAALTRVRRYNWGKTWIAMSWLSALLALGFWLLRESAFWLMLLTLAYTAGMLYFALRAEFAVRRAQERLPRESGARDYVDEDRFWLWGLFYCNPDDRRTLVSDRTGMGMGMNLAKPAGKITMGLVALILVIGVPLAALWFIAMDYTPREARIEDGVLYFEHFTEKYEIALDEISGTELLDELPSARRVAGTGLDTLCEGRFDVEGYENVRISLDPGQGCCIVVLTEGGLTRIFNLMTEAETEGFYAELTAAL